MRTSAAGVKFIAGFEGWFPRPYNDPVGYATVGFGHLLGYRGVTDADRRARWVPGQDRPGVLTISEGYQLLARDLGKVEREVRAVVRVPITQGQFDALVSFTFNCGGGALRSSTVLRRLNRRDYRGAADALMMWTKAGGRVLPGLVRRRREERVMFLRAARDPYAGLTDVERRWCAEYDRLKAADRDLARRRVLRRRMEAQRKRIWRAARGAGGWGAHNRRARYKALLRRSR